MSTTHSLTLHRICAARWPFRELFRRYIGIRLVQFSRWPKGAPAHILPVMCPTSVPSFTVVTTLGKVCLQKVNDFVCGPTAGIYKYSAGIRTCFCFYLGTELLGSIYQHPVACGVKNRVGHLERRTYGCSLRMHISMM